MSNSNYIQTIAINIITHDLPPDLGIERREETSPGVFPVSGATFAKLIDLNVAPSGIELLHDVSVDLVTSPTPDLKNVGGVLDIKNNRRAVTIIFHENGGISLSYSNEEYKGIVVAKQTLIRNISTNVFEVDDIFCKKVPYDKMHRVRTFHVGKTDVTLPNTDAFEISQQTLLKIIMAGFIYHAGVTFDFDLPENASTSAIASHRSQGADM
jgi:hypothetical protein